MDDEIARPGCKVDLTAREDDYLSSRFTKLSASGHDLTPLLSEEMIVREDEAEAEAETEGSTYLGSGLKGVYVCRMGGLPLFSSGCVVQVPLHALI